MGARPISAVDIETYTDSYVRALMTRDHVLGVTVAVVQGDTPLVLKGYGYDRLSPARAVAPDRSLFRLGSVTKVFTWIVTRQEIEAGRVALDTPIQTYVGDSWLKQGSLHKPVTMRALMSHSAGYDDTELGHLFVLNPRLNGPIDSYYRQHQPKQVRDPLLFATYSNFGASVASRVVTHTAKAKDVPSLMDARIFTPLGLRHTTLREPYDPALVKDRGFPAPMPKALSGNLSEGYIWTGKTYQAQGFEYTTPMIGALGGTSTSQDMARLMSLMLRGGNLEGVQLYDPFSAQAFSQPLLDRTEGFNGWASGLMMLEGPAGLKTYGHSGQTLWFSANMIIVPELNLGIFIAANTSSGENLTLTYPHQLLSHLSGEAARPPLKPRPDQAFAMQKPLYKALSGHYVSTRRAYGGLEGAISRLLNTVRISFEKDGTMVLRNEDGVSTYVGTTSDFYKQQFEDDTGPASLLGTLHFLRTPQAEGARIIGFETESQMARFEKVSAIFTPGFLVTFSFGVVFSCVLLWLYTIKGVTGRYERPSEPQERATLVSLCQSVLWVLAIFLVYSWQSGVAAAPHSLFLNWPSGVLRIASTLAGIASLATLYQFATLYFIYVEDRRFNDGWSDLQKVSHTVLQLFWGFFALVLGLWGALNPFS